MKKITLILLLLSAFACSKKPKELRRSQIVGKWTNLTLMVTMNRYDQEDSVLRAHEKNWEEVLKIKPIISSFNEDGSFSSEYYNLQGELAQTTTGTWDVRNDSLIIWTAANETAYHFTINGDRVRFKATMDWDEDGLPDTYDAVQVRLPEQ